VDPVSPPLAEGVNFLTTLVKNKASLSAVCTARSALSCKLTSYEGVTFGNTDLVKRFIKGVFESNPTFPKQSETWDVNIVLNEIKTWTPVNNLTLKQLTLKAVMLIALLSGQRCQTMATLNIETMSLNDKRCTFFVHSLLKQTRRRVHQKPIELLAFKDEPDLCIVTTLKEYLNRTKPLRGNDTQLFISLQKPHRGVSTDTISRWIRDVLDTVNIDTSVFSAHSTRGASTSAAKQAKIPIKTIMDAAGWSRPTTFANFYNKAIMGSDHKNFGQAILDRFLQPK